MGLKIILTGATGMVGEGVLAECLENDSVSKILVIGRKPTGVVHSKISELIVSELSGIGRYSAQLSGYDTCFYCAGISSRGMSEEKYADFTFKTTIEFSKVLKDANPDLIFNFISGYLADSTEEGRTMWARVKGKTENELHRIFQKKQFSFRPALMKPFPSQIHIYGYNRWSIRFFTVLNVFFPSCTLQDLGRAMISTSLAGYPKTILEPEDILDACKRELNGKKADLKRK